MERGWARMWRNKRVCVCVCVCVCACVYETHLSATLEVCVTSSNSVIMTKARGQEGVFCQKHIPLKDTLPHTHAQTHTHTHTHARTQTHAKLPLNQRRSFRNEKGEGLSFPFLRTHTHTHYYFCLSLTNTLYLSPSQIGRAHV